MLYSLTSEFTQIEETTGTIQNSSHVGTIEMSTSDTPDSGILIYPLQKVSFSDQTIYLRCIDGYAEARVLPFELVAEGGDSSSNSTPFDAGDLDIRKYDSTGLLIYYTDAAGNLHEKPVHYVNPNSNHLQLAELGKSLIDLTENTYRATYRVDKVLCDFVNKFSEYIVVDLPLTEDLTDRCGNIWQAVGDISFEDGALNLELTEGAKNYIYTDPPELGSSDFAIEWDEWIPSSRDFFLSEVISIDGSAAKSCMDVVYLNTSTPKLYAGQGAGTGWKISHKTIGAELRDQWVHRTVIRNGSEVYAYENGTLFDSATFDYSISVTDCYLFIGNFLRDNRQFVGKIKNVKIYVGH